MNKFSQNLKEFRTKRNMSVRAFSQALSIPYTTYSNYEAGGEPKLDTLIKIADYLNVSVDELLGYIPKRTSNEYEYYKQWLLSTKRIKIDDSGDLIHIFFKNIDNHKFVVGAVEETYLLTVEKKENLIAIAKYIENGVFEQQERNKILNIIEFFSFIINMASKPTDVKARFQGEFKDIINSINITEINSERIYDIDKYIETHYTSRP